MKFKKIVESKKEIKDQKDLVDEMDLDVKTAEEKAKEDIKTNKKVFKDALKQCSLVEGFNYTNNENNYTVNLKNRSELAKLIESLKQNNIKHRISRSKTEGYRYDVTFKYELKESNNYTFKFEVHAVDDKDENKVYKEFNSESKAKEYAKKCGVKCFIDKVTYCDDEFTDSDTIYGPIDLEENVEKTEVKKITTPRGTFEVVDKTEDELRKDGYGYHHSGNGYKIFVKNNQAVAIKECNLKENNINQTTRKVSKQKGNNTPITDEDQKKEWEAEDDNNWNESKNKKLKEMFEPISSFKEYTYIDKTNQGWEIKKAFRDLDDDRLHVIVYRPKRNDYAIGLGYSPDGGYWNQGRYDYINMEDAIADLKNDYNVEPFNLKLAKLKKNESLKEDSLRYSTLKKGDKVKLDKEKMNLEKIQDKSLLDDTYEVVGFWYNQELVDDDRAPEHVRDLSGLRIKNDRTGKEYDINRFQLTSIDESLKEGVSEDLLIDLLTIFHLYESSFPKVLAYKYPEVAKKLLNIALKEEPMIKKYFNSDEQALKEWLHKNVVDEYFNYKYESLKKKNESLDTFDSIMDFNRDIYNALARVCERYQYKDSGVTMQQLEGAVEWFTIHAEDDEELYFLFEEVNKNESLKEGYFDYMDKDYADILNQNVDVYDLDKFIADNTDGQYEPHYMHKAAIIVAPNGKGCIVDYEAIGQDFDSIEDEVNIPLHEKETEEVDEQGNKVRHISLVATHSVEVPVQDIINEASKETMTYREFFNKYKYNDRCSKNFRELIAHLKKNGMFEEEQTSEENIEECNLTEDTTYQDVKDFIDNYLVGLCKKYDIIITNGWADGNSYDYIIKDKDTEKVLFYTNTLGDIEAKLIRIKPMNKTNENLTEKKTRQPKWRYNGNAEASAKFIEKGTNLAGQPCCEDYELDFEEIDEEPQQEPTPTEDEIIKNIINSYDEDSLDDEDVRNNIVLDIIEKLYPDLEAYSKNWDNVYSIYEEKVNSILDSTNDCLKESKYSDIYKQVRKDVDYDIQTGLGTQDDYYYMVGTELAARDLPFLPYLFLADHLNEQDEEYQQIKQGYIDNGGKINESLKESDEDDIEDITLDDIDIDDIDVDSLDDISVDDIVDEDAEALNILKDKLDIEIIDEDDDESPILSIKPKEFDTKKAPELKVEVEQEEAEKINNTFNKEEEKVEEPEEIKDNKEDSNLPAVANDEDNIDFDEITDAEQVDAKQALAGLKKISVIDKKEDNKEEEKPAEDEEVEVEEDDDDTSFLDKLA